MRPTITRHLAVAALLLGAAVPAARAQTKVAYVDYQRALGEIDEGKAAQARLTTEKDQKQKMFDDRKVEFQRLQADYAKQASVLSEQARNEKQGDLEKRAMELQAYGVQLQKDLLDREQEVMRPMLDKMHAIVKEIADAEGVQMVVSVQAVVYAAPALDITNELVRKYNARHKVAAGAPANGAKPAADKKPASADKKPPAAKKETK